MAEVNAQWQILVLKKLLSSVGRGGGIDSDTSFFLGGEHTFFYSFFFLGGDNYINR